MVGSASASASVGTPLDLAPQLLRDIDSSIMACNDAMPMSNGPQPCYISPAQFFTGPTQPGAYINRDDEDLVSSSTGFYAGWVANFRPNSGMGSNTCSLLGSDYQLAKAVKAGSHRLVSAHEFRLVDGKTALIETPIPRQVSLKPWGGDDSQNWLVSGGFQKVDIETGEVLFEWESFDHVDPKQSAFQLDFGKGIPGSGRNETDAWNYFHINSVDKDDEKTTYSGRLPVGSDFKLADAERFAFQHHARFRGRSADGTIETISFFDNGAHSAPIKTNHFSRARIVQLNHTSSVATAVHTFDAPDGLSAHTQGSVQPLPNGNVFVNWGEAGAVTEFSKDGDVLFHSYLDAAPSKLFQSYRGFRANWTAVPAEEPAIVALKASGAASSGIEVFVWELRLK